VTEEPADQPAARSLLPLDAAGFRPHPLHVGNRNWTETNCYVDVWIEVLHALGLEPLAASAFTLSAGFEGDQWTFFKFPPEDLRRVFGLEVNELNVWKPVLDHVLEQLDLGRLCTVEADSWFLPDTRGDSYHEEHVKSTVVPQMVDVRRRRLGYFHNAGYFELEGDDFDGVFQRGSHADPAKLAPYVEVIRLDRLLGDDAGLVGRAVELTREHLGRRPRVNPIAEMGARLHRDLPWLAGEDLETFHLYAFGTCRQCGASTEMAASFVDWLNRHDGPGTESAAEDLRSVAEGAKALQFALARVARGRRADLESILSPMAERWERAVGTLECRYGG
jgi:Domain of unknown function (DUF1839)